MVNARFPDFQLDFNAMGIQHSIAAEELMQKETGQKGSQHPPEMALKVGVMGGSGHDIPAEVLGKAREAGKAIAEASCVLITGACPGIPLAAAEGAKQAGGFVVGISPGLSLDEHVYKYESPTAFHDVLIFTGSGLMGREVVNIRSSDIVIFAGGSSGTLGELAIAYDEGKLIGILTGTGGICDLASQILAACKKTTGARVVEGPDGQRLVPELVQVYRQEHYRRPSCFCHTCNSMESSPPSPKTERDLVCGMWLDPAIAVARRTISGRRYFLCSLACAEKFDTATAKYLERG